MFYFWIISKYTASWRRFFDTPIILTIIGLAMGVAVLVMAMASFSGFQTTLKRSIIEVSGDVNIYKRGSKIENAESLIRDIGPDMKDVQEYMSVLTNESLVAGNGKISTALVHGVEKEKVVRVSNIHNHVIAGKVNWDFKDDAPPVYIGKDLAKKLKLKVGDTFKIILPKTSKSNSSQITPIAKNFYITAIVDLGKYEYNARFLFVDLPVLQELVGTQKVSQIRFKLKNIDKAEVWAKSVQEKIGWIYAVMDWKQLNRNFIEAIDYEKWVIFFVVLIIVIAACFNMANTLFVTVLKRYRDISLLKTLGASSYKIVTLFCVLGLFLGSVGLTFGILLGIIFCYLFEILQTLFPLLPADIYKLSFVTTEVRLYDLLLISGATMFICFLSTLIPSIRGSFLSPVEGLKYE